jgi:ATP-dependent Lon protease
MGLCVVVLPKENEKDLADIPQEILSSITIRFVETMDEVLQIALERLIEPVAQEPVPQVATGFEAEAEEDKGLTN